MNAAWLGTLKNAEREEFRQSVLSSQIVLDKLREIVYNMYKKDDSSTLVDYDCPSWSHKQAHTNGRREALQQVIDLLSVDSKK